ncbi:Basic-leucine zipper transcription factor family protein [Quillaja saponaria]|uniref:Basic-leucine zipper transcription factor family protein n=1 Tax=Quillaja saponaria TaxID=32244 RepID=A0AAD7LUC7_QUISA|nr:Basic-leucine zipper transcription factor family protein [Quillaja saponaria]
MEKITNNDRQSGNIQGNQPWPRKPIEMNPPPISRMTPAKLPLSPINSFRLGNKPYYMNLGGAFIGASSSGTKPPYFHKPFNVIASPEPAVNDNNKKLQNTNTLDPAATVPGPNAGTAIVDVVDDDGPEAGQGVQTGRGRDIDLDMDPKKLKRILSNRVSAQKSRMKKLQHVSDLERKVKALEVQIAMLSPQIATYKNQHQMLLMEQQFLNHKLNACSSRKTTTEAEIEENKSEVNRLRMLHTRQQEQMKAQSRMMDWETGLELMPKSNQNQAALRRMVYKISNQDKGGEDATERNRQQNKVNMTQQPQKPGLCMSCGCGETRLNLYADPSSSGSEPNPQKVMNKNSSGQLGGMDTMLNFNGSSSDYRNRFI